MFSIDTRALTAIRIGLAAIILFQSFTTPLPTDPGTGLDLVADYVRLLIVPFALMLLIGYRTWMATIMCWALYGLPLRPGLFTPGGILPLESYMVTLFLFWAIFLPLGAHLSLDARRGGARPTEPSRYLSVATGAFLIQMFFIYFSAGVTKDMGEWVRQATALETIFGLPKYTGDVGRAMLAFPRALAVASVLTVILEVFGSLLLFIPGHTLRVRRIVITMAFIAFHIGLAVFMAPIGRFPYVMMVVWLAFFPPAFWDRVTGRTARSDPETDIVIDNSRPRKVAATLALIYIVVSNLFTWLYYPAREGFPGLWQQLGKYLLIYQQWAMFSVPSSL